MVLCKNNDETFHEIARITITNYYSQIIYDEYVKPKYEIGIYFNVSIILIRYLLK